VYGCCGLLMLCAEVADVVKLFGVINLCRYLCEMSEGFVIYKITG